MATPPVEPAAAAASFTPVFINTATLRSILTHKSLIHHFRASLPTVTSSLHSPPRQNYALSPSSSLLLMPSWSSSSSFPYLGVKLVTYFPQNSTLELPGVHGSYVLFDSRTGQTLASMDGTELTLWRTSCVSGLASEILARNDVGVLVMIVEKARKLAQELENEGNFEGVCFESTECLEEVVGMGDIVSCATNSESPLVNGARLKAGAHLDLVGSFRHSMRECDDEAIKRGRVFIDNEMALEEAGELVGAFERGVIGKGEIGGNLVELIKGEKVGRRDSEEVTVFKSVGSAVVDILSAQLVYETYIKNGGGL
ncbi:Protein SAR DEFICIENT 4 [Vitis vinifera]|uniref:Protein SAR DEFICIENT 4 n=1 Tax=Vitis vinifera TaxID=29760 RepID=A0A438E2I6_VITVI|nr:Protein SAR DEFICIENT 4 [Vitis vinifera]